MGAKALFSRSHLNISFRSIDLFCVTYPGPFFVIKKKEGNCGEGIYLSPVTIPVCVGVFLCV